MTPNLPEIARRPARYWSADGIPETVMGALWILWGASFLLGNALPRGSAYKTYWTLAPLLLAGSGVFAQWATKRLKEKYTFPRGGYVTLKSPGPALRYLVATIALVTAGLLAFILLTLAKGGLETRIAPIFGVILSLAFLVAALRQRAPYYAALAAVVLALGFAIGALVTGWDGLSWLFLSTGLATVAVGLLRLRDFLRQNPPPTEDLA